MKTKKPKIVFSSFDDVRNPAYGGGGAIAIHEVAKRLGENFNVTVLTGKFPGSRNLFCDGVKYKRVGLASSMPRLNQLLFHFALPRHILTQKHDLWVESFTPPFSTSFTPFFTKKPVIGLVHMLSGKDMARKYRIPFHIIENFGLKFYRHFIVLIKQSEREVREKNPSASIAIIGNGVNIPNVSNARGEGKNISFIGRIEVDQKGLDLLIFAYAKARKEIDMPPLVIAGSGAESEVTRVKELARKYGLEKSLTLLGKISGPTKEQFFRDTMIGVMSSRFETAPLVALEMMSYGIPVAAFDIPGISWIPENAIVRAKAFDSDELARVMVRLVKDRSLRGRLGANARAFAEEKSWEKTAKEYESSILKILNNT